MSAGEERVLALIPARGGSKGVPRKNIRMVAGRPLIEFTIATALENRDLFHRIVVSTDDEEIATVARRAGADVPFMRPAALATDIALSIDVVKHAVRFVEEEDGVRIGWIMLLQPTEPLRVARDLTEPLRIARETHCDSVVSVVQASSVHPMRMMRIENGRLKSWCADEVEGTRRQDYKPDAYMRNGSVYLSRRDIVMDKNTLRGDDCRPYVMPPERSVGIDSELDLKMVELLLTQQGVAPAPTGH